MHPLSMHHTTPPGQIALLSLILLAATSCDESAGDTDTGETDTTDDTADSTSDDTTGDTDSDTSDTGDTDSDTGDTDSDSGGTDGDTGGPTCECSRGKKPILTADGVCHCGEPCDLCPPEGCVGDEWLCDSRCCAPRGDGINVCIPASYCKGDDDDDDASDDDDDDNGCTCDDNTIGIVTLNDSLCHCGHPCDPCGELDCTPQDRTCDTGCCATRIKDSLSACIPDTYCLGDPPRFCAITCDSDADCAASAPVNGATKCLPPKNTTSSPDASNTPHASNTPATTAATDPQENRCACSRDADCTPYGTADDGTPLTLAACRDNACVSGNCRFNFECDDGLVCLPFSGTSVGLCTRPCTADADCCITEDCRNDPLGDKRRCQSFACTIAIGDKTCLTDDTCRARATATTNPTPSDATDTSEFDPTRLRCLAP